MFQILVIKGLTAQSTKNNDLFLDIQERTQHCKVTRRCNVNVYSDVERWGQEEENGLGYKLERESPQRTKAYKGEGRGSTIDYY